MEKASPAQQVNAVAHAGLQSEQPEPGAKTTSARAQHAPEQRAKLSRRTWLKISIAAVLLCTLIAYLTRNLVLGTPVPSYLVVRTALQQTVVASGRIATPQRVSVASVLAGRVAAIQVLEGQTVVRGQLLIALDEQDLQSTFAQAQSGAAQASAALRKQRELA